MSRLHDCEESCLAAALTALEQSSTQGSLMPAVLVLDRPDLSILIGGAPDEVQHAGSIAIPGLSATTAAYCCDTWTAQLPNETVRVDLGELAAAGGIESGLVRESLAVSSFDLDEGYGMFARHYRRLVGGGIEWTPARDYRDDKAEGRVASWLRAAFNAESLAAFTEHNTPDALFDRQAADAMILSAVMMLDVQVAMHTP